ncbi:hypothetical protein F2Q69_00045836 [Brassica cretica]|uniref:DUF4378 domain-containing protein n=1 Tax=Brassica cretica TaxID=69181 RepID=A0A8S9N5S1_BRACR|nr:hypothetical protein F2Q69_00045836 [Brassica cretica]
MDTTTEKMLHENPVEIHLQQVEWSELLKITQAATIRMGRKLREKVTCSPIQSHPGFMWGLFDILKHNHWRYIKKRLPHKRPLACTRSASADCISVSKSKVEDETIVDSVKRPKKPSSSAVKSKESNSGEKPKKPEDKSKNLNSEEKRRKTHSEIKRSVKALIKALVIEDKSKKKGRHHRRSSTYPVQSNPKEKDSLSELVESSDKNSSNGDERNRVFNQTIGISPAIGSLNPLYLMSEESSNSDSEDFKLDNIPVDDTDENKSDFDESDSKKKDDEEEAWLDPKLGHTENEDDDTSPRRAKSCLDALNLIHMNRNFLLKVLQDPGSPLARHFQNQQSFSSKTMTKAGSFPTHGSNREDHNNGFDSVENKSMSSPSIAAQHRADGVQTFNEAMEKSADEEDLSGSGYTRKRGKNQVVIKRFKDLRQKIKHVINENKNEKHRITMDAVLDKVPRKYGFSKDLRHDILKGSPANKAQGAKLKQIRRTSSLCGSVDRYLQLYESSVQREAKKNNNTSEKLEAELEESAGPSEKRVPKVLGRILSSPEMKSPYALKIEDLPGQLTTFSRSLKQEQDVLEDISEISEDQSESSEHEMPETTDDPSSEAEQDREILMLDVEPETKSLDESSGDSPTFDEIASESRMPLADSDTESVSRSKQLESIPAAEILQVEAQDKGKFNYVRDILEISGFNAPESLSMWQSEYQPLDPLVYEQVTTTTGCMIQDPECSRNEEEGGNCNHLLLFDLINEVLIEIYERSYHYCPKPLSSLCRIHPMPVGYSVLKEVWVRINCYLRYKPLNEESFDKIMSRDLSREDGWMDLQFESECVGIEVEDLIFEELLEELLVVSG